MKVSGVAERSVYFQFRMASFGDGKGAKRSRGKRLPSRRRPRQTNGLLAMQRLAEQGVIWSGRNSRLAKRAIRRPPGNTWWIVRLNGLDSLRR